MHRRAAMGPATSAHSRGGQAAGADLHRRVHRGIVTRWSRAAAPTTNPRPGHPASRCLLRDSPAPPIPWPRAPGRHSVSAAHAFAVARGRAHIRGGNVMVRDARSHADVGPARATQRPTRRRTAVRGTESSACEEARRSLGRSRRRPCRGQGTGRRCRQSSGRRRARGRSPRASSGLTCTGVPAWPAAAGARCRRGSGCTSGRGREVLTHQRVRLRQGVVVGRPRRAPARRSRRTRSSPASVMTRGSTRHGGPPWPCVGGWNVVPLDQGVVDCVESSRGGRVVRRGRLVAVVDDAAAGPADVSRQRLVPAPAASDTAMAVAPATPATVAPIVVAITAVRPRAALALACRPAAAGAVRGLVLRVAHGGPPSGLDSHRWWEQDQSTAPS